MLQSILEEQGPFLQRHEPIVTGVYLAEHSQQVYLLLVQHIPHELQRVLQLDGQFQNALNDHLGRIGEGMVTALLVVPPDAPDELAVPYELRRFVIIGLDEEHGDDFVIEEYSEVLQPSHELLSIQHATSSPPYELVLVDLVQLHVVPVFQLFLETAYHPPVDQHFLHVEQHFVQGLSPLFDGFVELLILLTLEVLFVLTQRRVGV